MPSRAASRVAEELERIETLIAAHPEGIGMVNLIHAYGARSGRIVPRRTLSRRLAALVRTGRVVTGGAGPTRKYLPAAPAPLDSAPTPEPSVREATAERDEEYVPVSPAGAELQALIRRPIGERQPAGYEREFLERYAPGKTWYLPRELRERLHRIGRTPDGERPAGTFARDIYGRLLIDLAWASSRLEGNTYTRLDTQNLIEFGQRAEGKDAEDAQMILNHKAAIELIVEDAEHVGFDRHTLLGLHSALSENLLGDPRDEGRLRNRPVLVTGTPFVPIAIPQVIEDCFALLLEKAGEIPDPFEQAFFAMVHIPYLQPFADVNKRTSRLAANIPLVKENLCPLSFVDVPERAYVEGTLAVYELTRVELLRDVFAWAYERSCARYKVVRDSMVQPDPLRLRYRNELAEVVRETVLALAPPRLESLRAAGQAQGVPAGDVPGFAERALELLLSLHEGNAGRYRLRPSEYSQWRSQFTGA